jgi:CHAD domain-containing protein
VIQLYHLEPTSYLKTLNQAAQKANEKIQKYLENPNEDNVHDARTAIRRLVASYSLLPKKLKRKPATAKFVSHYKKFFRVNSQIRDYDIISSKISSSDAILKLIKKKKKKKLITAKKQAEYAKKIRFPNITADEISNEKLEKKFNRIAFRLIERIQILIPSVIENEKNVFDLHELRKDCKKLRYLLEIVNSTESSNLIERLKQIQDSLGAIHDADITLDFLKKLPQEYDTEIIIKNELSLRKTLYEKFVLEHKILST